MLSSAAESAVRRDDDRRDLPVVADCLACALAFAFVLRDIVIDRNLDKSGEGGNGSSTDVDDWQRENNRFNRTRGVYYYSHHQRN